MCGRFSITAGLPDILDSFQVNKVAVHYEFRYNISPTQHVPVIVSRNGQRIMEKYRWGLFPYWAKDSINTDCESLTEKRAFRKMFSKNRCIIPSSGFYSWKRHGNKQQPVCIKLRDRNVFGMAGIYDVWKDPRGNEIRTFTIITSKANSLVAQYQERMPVILEDSYLDFWLDPGITDENFLQRILMPGQAERMTVHPVSPAVNDENNESPECVEEYYPDTVLVKN